MTNDVAICRPEDSVKVAAKLMWERDCGCVPIVDEDRRVKGMITDRDITMAAYFQGRALEAIPVSSVMSRDAWCCHAEDDVEDAEALMQQKRVRRLPVVDAEGVIQGIVSLNDLATHAEKAKSASTRKNGNVGFDELATTLKAVSEHRPEALSVPAHPSA